MWRARRSRRDAPSGQRGDQCVPFRFATGAATKDMQTVAELAFLQIANEAIDTRDRFGWRGGRRKTEIILHAGGARLVADRRHKPLAPRRVEPIGGGVFVQ